MKGVGEPPICASAAVVLAIKEAIMFYRHYNFGWKNWFSLEPPCTPNKICQIANSQSQDQVFVVSVIFYYTFPKKVAE